MNFYKTIQIVFVTCIVLLSNISISNAQNGSYLITGNTQNSISISNNNYSGFKTVQELNELKWINVKSEKGDFIKFTMPGFVSSKEIGNPDLPAIRKLIEVPENACIQINILKKESTEISLSDLNILYPVISVQPPCPKSEETPPFEMNDEVYNTDTFYSEDLATVEELGYMRGIRIARLDIAPFEYNPVSHKIKVYTKLEIEIRFENSNISATKEKKSMNASPFFEAANKRLFNYKPLQLRDTITKYPVTYVIVSDPMFQEQLQPFTEWKTKKGFKVIEAYTDDPQVGTTTSSIKSYLETLYYSGTPENPAPSFVLFVGDVDQVPTFTASSAASDLHYCEFTNDYFPEIYFGRFSATNPDQLQPQIDKTLQYEQYTMPDPSYLEEVVLVSGVDGSYAQDWGNGQINYGTENYFNAAHGINAHVYLYPQSGSSGPQIIQDISDGVGFGNYTAHCSSSGWADPSFTNSDIPGLQNEDQYGLLIGNCCQSNAFDVNSCFGESLLRAEGKGAVGYIGGSNNTMWDEDYYFGVGVGTINEDPPSYEETTMGAYDGLFHDHGEPFADWYITNYQVIFIGNMAVTEGKPGSAEYYWDIYCVMGDPSVMTYLSVPQEMTVSYDALMPLASPSFTVYAEPYSYVAISKDGVLHGTALANENGEAIVYLDPITVPGEADVVVTGQNLQPYMGTVVVASPDGPYVLFDELEINDNQGNNNGMADYGESISLNVTLENVGNSDASNVTAELSTTDENVTITNNIISWPDIPSGETSMLEDAFSVEINELVPDMHKVSFDLAVTDGDETWNSALFFNLHAPILEVGNYWIDDSYAGNGNGVADPGEMVDVYITNLNTGSCVTGEAIASLFCSNEHITLYNSNVTLGVMQTNHQMESVFTLVVDPEMPVGHTIDLEYTLTSEPYETAKVFSMKVGLVIEDFETGDFMAFDWIFDGVSDWTINESEVYSGVYSAKSGAIGNSSTTSLSIEFEVISDDSISFYRKVSTEAGYDYMRFYIDNTIVGQWAGELDWDKVIFPVSEGLHTFKWEYYKDYYVTGGSDCVWIDYITFPSMDAPGSEFELEVNAYPETLCHGNEAMLFAIPSGGSGSYSYQWTQDGTISDPAIFNPSASPDETTVYYVEINDGVDTLYGEVMIEVVPHATAPEISQVEDMLVSSIEEGNQWYLWSIPLPDATGQTFTPTASGQYHATVTNEYGCESDPSNTIYYVYTAIGEPEKDFSVVLFPNPATDNIWVNANMPGQGEVNLSLINSLGQPVISRTIQSNGELEKTIVLNTKNLKPGVYYCKVVYEESIVIEKIILTR